MQLKLEQAEKEVTDLEQQLADKKAKLQALKQEARQEKVARLDQDSAKSLAELLPAALHLSRNEIYGVEVDPLVDVRFTLGINQQAQAKVSRYLSPLVPDGLQIIPAKGFAGNPQVAVVFPIAHLKSVMEGLQLGQGIDLSADVPAVLMRC